MDDYYMNDYRKIFNYDNLSESKIVQINDRKNMYNNTISAAGCLFYKDTTNGKELLLIKYADPTWPKLDDLGGKVDNMDKSIIETIVREVGEESNNIISESQIRSLLAKKENMHIYNKQSKYYLILVKVDEGFFSDTSVFGNKEEHDKIIRRINWYNFPKIKLQLAYRLLGCAKLMQALSGNTPLVKKPTKTIPTRLCYL
jgi:hypothetical protein